jgi:single-strand DNA-binding protein
MNALRNKVQLIGHVGNDPEIKIFEGGKLANFTLATNETYKMTREKSGGNAMASISRLGKAADIMEKFVTKGKEIAIEGRTHRSYDDKMARSAT